jgi:hypothetical protein
MAIHIIRHESGSVEFVCDDLWVNVFRHNAEPLVQVPGKMMSVQGAETLIAMLQAALREVEEAGE